MTVEHALTDLVAALPERYQPIYGHAEWASAARRCDDRAAMILSIAKSISGIEKRPLRVLDLGCAQGFFGLTLAANGMQVHGIDVLDANVAVCKVLNKEHNLDATFEVARLQDHIAAIGRDTYDLVLGLSIFHHVIHSEGLERAKELLGVLASKIPHAIFEFALAEEPVHWAPSQPADVRSLLAPYSCVSELGRFPTHLSSVTRPMLFASNSVRWIDGAAALER